MDNPGPAFPPCPAHRNYCMTSPQTTPRLVSGSQIIRLSGLVGSALDGSSVRAQGRGDVPEALGLEVAESLLAQGARALIDATDPS